MIRSLALLALLASAPARAGDGRYECLRMVGIAGGVVEVNSSWEFLGRGPAGPTASPMFALACRLSPGKVAAWLGGETAPTYAHVAWEGDLRAHWWSMSGGVDVAAGKHAVGPIVSMGLFQVGGGLRALWRTHDDKKGRRRGIETRVVGWYGGGWDVQMQLMYTIGVGKF